MNAIRNTLVILLPLLFAACASAPEQADVDPQAALVAAVNSGDDPFLWLEDTRGDKALAWVEQEDARTLATSFASDADFKRTQQQILEVLDSDQRIPYLRKMGGFYYNYWKDQDHPRGLWRRTTLASYESNAPQWETVLDVDALGEADGHPWVFKGAQCLKPDYERCLLSLSPQGGDAVVVREFDIPSKSFVEDGFELPESKTDVAWIDEDHIYVGTNFGRGSMTESSYPRIVKEWTRGKSLSRAKTVHEARKTDLGISAWHDRTPGFERDFVTVITDFFHSEMYQRTDTGLVHVEVPSDASTDVHRQWLLVEPKTDWTLGNVTWTAGSLLAIDYDKFMAGYRNFQVLFRPDEHTALSSYAWTRNHLILNLMQDVKGRILVLTPAAEGPWSSQPLPGVPDNSTVSASAVDADSSDDYWLHVSGYLTPSTLAMGTIGEGEARILRQEPAFFDASQFTVSQHFATSEDGTRVPYFEIAPKNIQLDGSNRTLLYGYGGFEVSLRPGYSGSVGRAWLERGGVYVVANIRGGGEYGPRWHRAAMKDKRLRAYEDFSAVARDLIRRGVTSPAHLGAEGGSNGGLLMGNMLTQYPDLFGAIACEVPLLDMQRYIHLQAGASWIGEYGDPADPAQWEFIKTFSPYHNLKPGTAYPPVLFYTSTSDDRVGPEQARKMAALMMEMGYRDVWFYENTEGGHGAGADNRQSAHMRAMAWNFLWQKLQ